MRDKNQVVLPMNLEVKIPENDPVKILVELCNQLNYENLLETYVRKWRKLNPITLFMILLLGYVTGRYSSREIEESCRTDIRFMWILGDEPVPDHSTIARFQNGRLTPIIEDLFYQLVEKISTLDNISYKNVFIDGTKIEANANRYTFVWAKAVKKNNDKLDLKIETALLIMRERYNLFHDCDLNDSLDALSAVSNMERIVFVYGSGKRKTQIQKDIEQLTQWVERKTKYAGYQSEFKGRNSFSKTDTDATFMRMKDDHMKNGQLKPGYNVQIAVEGEYIVGLGLFSNPNDVNTLIPFLNRMYEHTHKKIENVIADAGYESEENYTYLDDNKQTYYIKPSDYERQKSKKYRENIYRVDNLLYCEEADAFTCPEGRILNYIYDKKQTTVSGYTLLKRQYRCESCMDCSQRTQCFKGSYENRQISISLTFGEKRKKSLANITTKHGVLLRMNRSIQVEGAFGVLKQDYGFTRFLTRGKQNTETQFFLLSMAFNLRKLGNKRLSNRLGKSLFEKMIA